MSGILTRAALAVLRKVPEGYGMTNREALQYAIAVIEVLKHPTPEMKAAGAARIGDAGYDLAHDAYVSMIDTALGEGAN